MLIIHTILAFVLSLQPLNLSNIKLSPIISKIEFSGCLRGNGFFIYNMSKVCGIYKIISPKGKIYIGQSKDITDRFRYYKRLSCKKQTKLYNSLKKHGVENHKFEIVEECPKEQLNEREIHYIKLFDCFNTKHGLNLKIGGGGGSLSEETKSKISKAVKGEKHPLFGKHHSEETKMKMSKSAGKGVNHHSFGKKISEETKRKISETTKGVPKSEETRKRMSQGQTGRKHSDEHRRKNSEANSGAKHYIFGKKQPEEAKRKNSEAHIGKKPSEETKKKISEAQKKRWDKIRQNKKQ